MRVEAGDVEVWPDLLRELCKKSCAARGTMGPFRTAGVPPHEPCPVAERKEKPSMKQGQILFPQEEHRSGLSRKWDRLAPV